MCPAALHKIPTQTVDSSQVLAGCIRQKQPQISRSLTKKLGRKHRRPRTGLSQTRPRSHFNVLIAKDSFIQIDIISVIKHLVLNAQNSYMNAIETHKFELKQLNTHIVK